MSTGSDRLRIGNAIRIGVCMHDREARGRIDELLRSYARIHHCQQISDIAHTLEESEGAAAVYEITDEDPLFISALIRLRMRFPDIPLMLVIGRAAERARTIAEDARVMDRARVVVLGVDDLSANTASLIDEAKAMSTAWRLLAIMDRVGLGTDRCIRQFLLQTVQAPREISTVAEIASIAGISTRTLQQRLHARRLPPPHVLVSWVMVFRAACLLQDPQSTLKRLVRLLPFPDQPSVTHRFRRYLGLTATEVREPGGIDRVVARFEKLLAAAQLDDGQTDIEMEIAAL